MIYVLARHEGQYQTWCRKNGLIPGGDVKRILSMAEFTLMPLRMRVIKLEGWSEMLDTSPIWADHVLKGMEAVVTRVSDW